MHQKRPFSHGLLADDHVTLAELLRATDRRTAGFVSLGVLRTPSGLSQGFDEYQDDFALDGWKPAGEMNDRLVSWLEQAEDSFFVWAHYSDPHEPYSPPTRTYPRIAVRQDGREEIEISANASTVSIPLIVPPGYTVIQVSSVPVTDPRPIRIQDIRTTDARVDATCASGCDDAREGSSGRGIVAAIDLINRNTSDTNVALRFRADELLSLSEVRERYRQEVEYADREIGVLLSALERAGHRDNTLVILTADNGEGLGNHGYLGHAGSLFEEQLRVPLILSWPAGLPAGKTVDAAVSLVDVLPTITQMLAIPDPSVRTGRGLVPLIIKASQDAEDLPVVAETFRPQAPRDLSAVVAGDFKLIADPTGRTALYDLARDLRELENEAEHRPELVAQLGRMIADQLGSAPLSNPVLTEDQERRLRSLGYVR